MSLKKKIDMDDVNIDQEADIYADFNHQEDAKIEKENVNQSDKATPYSYKEKEYNGNYLESHTVVTRASKMSRVVLFGFYMLFIVVAAVVFLMLRADRYEFYVAKDEVSLNVGSTYQVELIPKHVRYFDYMNYNYEIENEDIATVDEYGTVTAVGSGTTNLKISLSPGLKTKKMKINTENIPITSIQLMLYKNNKLQKVNSVNMISNQSITLKAIANNDESLNTTVKYSSNNTNVLVVDDFGNVTAKNAGTAIISGSRDGIVGTLTINVQKQETSSPGSSNQGTGTGNTTNPGTGTGNTTPSTPGTSNVKVTGIDIGTNQVVKYVGDTLSLSPTLTPSNAKASSITWTSSNTSVATVDQNGQVKTIKAGTAVITVNVDGIKDTCIVVVRNKTSGSSESSQTPQAGTQVSASEVTISPLSLTIDKGKTATFDITVSGAAGTISVSSSNGSVITITSPSSDSCNNLKCFFDAQTGKEDKITYTVTGVGEGNAYINVSIDDMTSYDEKTVTGSGKIGVLVK